MTMVIKSMKYWCFFFVIVFVTIISANGMTNQPLGVVSTTTTAPLNKPKTTLPKVLAPQDYLSFAHYQKTCPDLESIIQNKTTAWINKDPTLAASIIRLHFHDCAIRGCDASILLNHANSERWAKASKTLRGFQVIDDIKAEVEKRCPKTVSCADILTTAARDATVLVNGPFWEVPFGRKDGRISIAKEADLVPNSHENITALIQFFQARGLNLLDLVILSGSHTIGRSTCGPIQHRITSNDPSIDIKYSNNLKKLCKTEYDYVNLDVTTPKTFDVAYYTNLQKKMGLLSTDQLLYSDARTASFVPLLASQPDLFFNQFAVSMVKLGNVQVLTRNFEGEIRKNCNFVNP